MEKAAFQVYFPRPSGWPAPDRDISACQLRRYLPEIRPGFDFLKGLNCRRPDPDADSFQCIPIKHNYQIKQD